MKVLSVFLFITFLTIGCGSGGGGGEDPPPIQQPSKTTVSGTVLDGNGEPIEGAEVTIHSDPIKVITDSNGYFSVELEVGDHKVVIKKGSDEIYSKIFSCSENTPFSLDRIITSYYPALRKLISNIEFADSNLEACVNVEANNSIAAYADELTFLDCYDYGITNITGIAWFTNLQYLSFWLNNISNISELAGLTNLQELDLDDNNISNISVLAGLESLQTLYLSFNNISDIGALAGLINLQELDLWSNNISDISELAGPANLQTLDLEDNSISNISVLAGLTSLQTLYLLNNSITTGVADLVILVSAGDIYLNDNPQIPCNDLDTLETALGSSVVNRDYPPNCAP